MEWVSFDTRPDERAALERCATRAYAMDRAANGGKAQKLMAWQMDLIACHANGCPLDLDRLEKADDFNFAHDAFGIRRHLNRETGKLQNCFLPRFAARCQEPLPDDTAAMRSTIAAKRTAHDNRKGA